MSALKKRQSKVGTWFILLLLLTSVLLLLLFSESAQASPSLVGISDYGSVTLNNGARKIVRDLNGDLYVAYHKKVAGVSNIFVAKSVDNGESWGDMAQISSSKGFYPSIAVDSSNNLHLVWHGWDGVDYQIYYSKYNGTSWSEQIAISSGTGVQDSYDPSIAVDSGDNIHVFWRRSDGSYIQIYYNKYNGTSWSEQMAISSGNTDSGYAAVAIDTNSNLHVVWQKLDGSYIQIYYNKYNGTSWSGQMAISSGNTNSSDVSIAADSNNNIHVVWHKSDGTYDQVYYNKYSTSWSGQTALTSGSLYYRRPSIAIDSKDYLYVFSYREDGHIVLMRYNASWQADEQLTTAGENRYPNSRWSFYNNPLTGSNNRIDYIWTVGLASPYNIEYDYITIPSLFDSRDPNPPSIWGYWTKNEDVYLNGSGWGSNQTIRIKIEDPSTDIVHEQNHTADANGNFVLEYADLGSNYANGLYTVYVSTDGGSSWVEYDTFTVTRTTWIRPSYPEETLGYAGDIITVTAMNDDKAIKWANFTWKYPNGTIARISGFIPAQANVNISDNFVTSVSGIWIVEVQFCKAAKDPVNYGFSSTTFGITYRISISASPLVIPADGATTSTIAVSVIDVFDNPVENNVVSFTTDIGTLSNGTASGVTTLTATTNSSGVASVNLTSTTSGTATVTAVEELGASAYIKVGVDVNYITLTTNPEEILADGASNSTIIATVSNNTGPIPNNIVNFSTNLGTLSNSTVSGVTTLTATTDSSGEAVVTLTSAATAGTATVTVVEATGGSNLTLVSMTEMATFSGSFFNISQTKFPREQAVYVKAIGLQDKIRYCFNWYYPNGTLARQSPWLKGFTFYTDFLSLTSDAVESSNWTIVLVNEKGSEINVKKFTAVPKADLTPSPTEPSPGQQVSATATTQVNPSGAINANFTWHYPNGSIARTIIRPVNLVSKQANDTYTPDTDGTWTLNVTFLNANDNEIDFNTTTFDVTGGAVIDITVYNIPILFGNLAPGNTSTYWPVNVTVHSNTNVAWNLTVKGSGNFISGANNFALSNLELSNTSTSITNSMTTSYQGPTLFNDWLNQPDPGIDTNRTIYFEINIPSGQAAGDYTTTVYVNVTQFG